MDMDSGDSEMDGVESTTAGQPSLERLKALDSLPDLTAQLKAADELCNHGHRAGMILRWLMGKLQKDRVSRLHPESWAIFTKCLRLIAPPKLGVLLYRFDLLAVIKDAVTSAELGDLLSILETTTQLLQTAKEIADGPQGASVKRLVCIDGTHAAAFFCAWIDRILELWRLSDKNLDHNKDLASFVPLLEPPIDIWQSRRPGASDNTLFAEHCLFSCSLLLRRVHALQPTIVPTKRKLNASESAAGQIDVQHELELLLAKHIFLPTRSAFFQAESLKEPDDAMAKVRDVFATLNHSNNRNSSNEEIAGTVPGLLDIGLRSVSVSTSRQRSKERPWVEALFDALLHCLDGQDSARKIRIGMLAVVGQRSSLRTETLRSIANKYAGLGSNSLENDDDEDEQGSKIGGKEVDFDLIANITKLDPSVFVEDAMADNLFRALTAQATEPDLRTNGLSEARLDTRRLSVLRPVMNSFANARKLDGFIKRWHRELQISNDRGPWLQLDEPFADLLELQYNSEQIRSLLEQYSAGIRAAKDVEVSNIEIFQGSVRADFVVLNAIMRGIRSDAVRDALQHSLQGMFAGVLHMRVVQALNDKKAQGNPSDLSLDRHAWQFLSQAFRLWFPVWAAQQSDHSIVASEARRLLSAPIIQCARAHTKATASSGEDVDLEALGNTAAAEQFVGLFCRLLSGYEGCHDLAVGYTTGLSLESYEKVSSAFVAFPSLLSLLKKDDCKQMIHQAVLQLAYPKSGALDPPNLGVSLANVVQNIVSTSQTSLLGDLLDELLEPLEAKKVAARYEEVALTMLLRIPTSALTREQRMTIINRLTGLRYGQNVEERQFNTRLALIVRHLEIRNLTAALKPDADTLWELCPVVKFPSPIAKDSATVGPSKRFSVETLDLLGKAFGHIFKHLDSMEETEEIHVFMRDMFERAVDALSSHKSKKAEPPQLDRMVLATHTIYAASGLLRRSEGVTSLGDKHLLLLKSAKVMLKDIEKSLEQSGPDEGLVFDDSRIRVTLDTMLAFTTTPIMDNFGLSRSKIVDTARKTIDTALAQGTRSSKDLLASVPNWSAAVSAYNLLRTSTRDNVDAVGQKLLDVVLSPEDREVILDVLGQQAKKENASGLSLKQVNDELDVSAVIVLQSTIPVIRKELLNTDDYQAARNLLPRLLKTLQSSDFAAHRAASSCILSILRDKPFLVNQHTIELTLATLKSLARTSPAEPLIYIDLCAILTAIFTHHRPKLQGRFHLVIALLQALQSRLFKPNKPSNTVERTRKALTTRHARAYTRLLTLFCNPTVHKRKAATELVDESRRARGHAGQYVQYLLHSFCAGVLSGTLGEGVRDALTPGLWAIIEAMEVHSSESVKVLSASMNNSERAVLRGVYDDWKRFGKWQGT